MALDSGHRDGVYVPNKRPMGKTQFTPPPPKKNKKLPKLFFTQIVFFFLICFFLPKFF